MKKSKFLQSSKDMLSRSFNPAKCKTSLRLAISRLKLMRNKKDVQVKQMRREISQLLESGQDRTARIRVEHVVREEKMMAAYDLLEIYCELIVARLPIIESQKNVPIDLKEAIASVIFASPRCGDVPELLDIRKHLTAKYGKDFTTAAIELRPDSGVGRMMVEKLSAVAPDGQTKVKILCAIAEEHNIKWDPSSFTEKDSVPPSDLLHGPNHFEKASTLYAESPPVEASPVQGTPSDNNVHSSLINVSQKESRTLPGTDNLSFQYSGVSSSQPTARPLGDNKAQVAQEDSLTSSLDGHNWNMGFKDAASAARAAAESAERASFAARAAAELSNREKLTRQSSPESRNSDGRVSKDGGETSGTPKLTSIHFQEDFRSTDDDVPAVGLHSLSSPKESSTDYTKKYIPSPSSNAGGSKIYESVNHDVPPVNANLQKNVKVSKGEISTKKLPSRFEAESTDDSSEKFENLREESGKPSSVKSSLGDTKKYVQSPSNSKFSEEYEPAYDVPDVNAHSLNLKVPKGEISLKESSLQCQAESANDWPGKSENFTDEGIRIRPSDKPIRSNSSISDDVNIFANSEDLNFGHDTFVRGGIHGEVSQMSYHESSDAVFDKSGSDNGGLFFGSNNDDKGSSFQLESQSPENFPLNRDSWSSKTSPSNQAKFSSSELFSNRENSFPDLSENSPAKECLELDNPVKFDYSDGPSSGSDEDLITSRHTVMEDSKDIPNQLRQGREFDSSKFEEKGLPQISVKPSTVSSDNELQSTEFLRERKQEKIGSQENFNLEKSGAHQPVARSPEFEIESDELENKYNPEIEGLGFGKLTGGFRQKGYNQPPFLKNPHGKLSLSKKKTEEANASSIGSTFASTDKSPKASTVMSHRKSSRTPVSYLDTDSDSSEEEEYLPKSPAQRKPGFALKTGGQVKTKTVLRAPNSVFGSDSSDLDEDVLKESHTKKNHLRSGISRRTKATPGSKPVSYIKTHRAEPETFDSERGSPISDTSEIQLESDSQRRNSKGWETYEHPTSAKVTSIPAKSSLWESPDQPPSKTQLKAGGTDHGAGDERKHAYKQQHKESKALDYDGNAEPYPSSSITKKAPPPDFEPGLYAKEGENYKRPAPAKEATRPDKPSMWAPPEEHRAASKPSYLGKLKTPEHPNSEKSTSMGPDKSKISHKPSASVQPSPVPTKTEASVSSENPKVSTLNTTKPNYGDSPLKASHVHPKLPDYDSLVQALRKSSP